MTDNEAILSQLAVPIWINQELIGMLNIEGPRKLLFENKNLTQQFVSQVAEIFRSAQEKDIFHRNLGMRVLTPLIFNIFIDAMQHLPRSNFFVLTRPILNGLEIRIYGVEYKKFDTEPFLLNLSHSSIDLDNIESRITSTNLFTKPTLHHFVGQWFEEVDKADMVEVEESHTDVVIRLEEFS